MCTSTSSPLSAWRGTGHVSVTLRHSSIGDLIGGIFGGIIIIIVVNVVKSYSVMIAVSYCLDVKYVYIYMNVVVTDLPLKTLDCHESKKVLTLQSRRWRRGVPTWQTWGCSSWSYRHCCDVGA